jgi:hypothetical protein
MDLRLLQTASLPETYWRSFVLSVAEFGLKECKRLVDALHHITNTKSLTTSKAALCLSRKETVRQCGKLGLLCTFQFTSAGIRFGARTVGPGKCAPADCVA